MTDLFLLTFLICFNQPPEELSKFQKRFVMGTFFEVSVPMNTPDQVIQMAFEKAVNLEKLGSHYLAESPLSLIRRGDPLYFRLNPQIRHELETYLFRAWWYMQQSEGAFHPAIDAPCPRPNLQEIEAWLKNMGPDSLKPLAWNLGGMLKGTAVDQMIELFQKNGILWALVNGGGDLRWYGFPPTIMIRQPGVGDVDIPESWVNQKEGALATSANDRRTVQRMGQDFPHIEFPKGKGPAEFQQVSVFAETAEKADVWATAVFVGGKQFAHNWAQKHDLAVFLVKTDGRIEVVGDHQHVFLYP